VAVGGARHGGMARGGSRCTGPKGRAERADFGGSEGETKMGRATKWAESQGGCSINSFFLILNRILDSEIKVLKYF
jgi:hypothetical protein